MGKEVTPPAEATLEELQAALAAKEVEIEQMKAVIEEQHARIVALESEETKLGTKLQEALEKVDDKLEVLQAGGRRVRALRRAVRILGKVIVFGMGVKKALQAQNPGMDYVAWEELSEKEQETIMAKAPHLFEEVEEKGKKSKTA
jgi:chromosome segregation ATPase